MSELRTNKIVPKDGMPSGSFGGGIIQVRYNTYSTDNSFNSAQTLCETIIGMQSASNKVMVDLRIRAKHEGTNGQYYIRLQRKIGSGGSYTSIGGDHGMHTSSYGTAGYMHQPALMRMYWDTPGSTGDIYYRVYIAPWGSPSSNLRLNPFDGDAENHGIQMILYEVSA